MPNLYNFFSPSKIVRSFDDLLRALRNKIGTSRLLDVTKDADRMLLEQFADKDAGLTAEMLAAQYNANLPKKLGGLGLPPENTAMQRADILYPTSAYHGRVSDFAEIDPAQFGSNTLPEFAKRGFFTSSDPDVAEGYVWLAGMGKGEKNVIDIQNAQQRIDDNVNSLINIAKQYLPEQTITNLKQIPYKSTTGSSAPFAVERYQKIRGFYDAMRRYLSPPYAPVTALDEAQPILQALKQSADLKLAAEYPQGGNIMPLRINDKGMKTVNMKGKSLPEDEEATKMIDQWLKESPNGVKLTNLSDSPQWGQYNQPSTVHVIPPDQLWRVRSTSAAFDPAQKVKNSLLASVGILPSSQYLDRGYNVGEAQPVGGVQQFFQTNPLGQAMTGLARSGAETFAGILNNLQTTVPPIANAPGMVGPQPGTRALQYLTAQGYIPPPTGSGYETLGSLFAPF